MGDLMRPVTAILIGLLLTMLAGLPASAAPTSAAEQDLRVPQCDTVRRLGQPGYVTFDGVRIARVSQYGGRCAGQRRKWARVEVYQSFIERGLDYSLAALVHTKSGPNYGIATGRRPMKALSSRLTATHGKCTKAVGTVQVIVPGRPGILRTAYSKRWTWPCR